MLSVDGQNLLLLFKMFDESKTANNIKRLCHLQGKQVFQLIRNAVLTLVLYPVIGVKGGPAIIHQSSAASVHG
ncbi:hypothetical protein D3C74_459520 [compost metagenome]